MPNQTIQTTTYIDPFLDVAFKRLFATDESKPILIGFLNELYKGKKYITEIQFGKNEYHGEIKEEGGVVFDIVCTDADGSRFIIEVQTGYQKYFKERALYYTSRAISEQSPKGKIKGWAYNISEVYLLAFLENFNLPDTPRYEYLQDICLANRHTGKIFYDKLSFIFIEMLNFVKKPHELHTELDKWLYALKHLTEFKQRPAYLSGPEFDQFFALAKYANLTKEERDMYNTSLKQKWDSKNVLDYAVEEAKHKKAVEIARQMLSDNLPIDQIIKYTKLSKEEIQALQK
ncbi:Rpn family recombination-promoting nuclease/putative transposase [Pedobacter heparinus]|uniref:Rpn family recombination-promoting nuclease/putative transposase n=1 Tax=Pedobacter heparinus (strain ATCC 13125 / DSM 2366 / CIP 104194 / JCM 7457 / NBRC 12017 / NCIMB 9290 / NRRL B-14731 / HIM 762-3) TaxID=485917 RepID=C6Y3K9_PEDHD|nr:Rpn family recombination-promoting nuclease/putative transposase [Pedobacter heparinus]ACU03288.1 conserved hypothetical protein [Pedobacter heparinus DSM 2366]